MAMEVEAEEASLALFEAGVVDRDSSSNRTIVPISTPTTTTNPATPTSNAGSNIHQSSPSTTKIYLNPAELFLIRDGYQLQWATKPAPWKIKKMQHSPSDQQAVDAAIDKFLKAGIIYRSPTQDRSYLSNFFTIQEPTKRRPILDCTRLNQHLQVQHFKMEGIPALRDLVEPDDYIVKVDLKDAYVVVPIHPSSQKFLSLENRGIVYQYSSLAFGLSLAPRIFTKLMRYAVEPLRAQGIRLIYYLDDICILEKSKSKLKETVQLVLQHLQDLGFLINHGKSVLTPNKIQEFLDFKIDTRKMEISLPQHKLSKLMQRLKQVEKDPERSCRWIAGLLGKITAVIPAVQEALLHIRHIQRDLARSLQTNHHQWDRVCKLTKKSMLEISWWKSHLNVKNGLPIHPQPLSKDALTVHVDALDSGWGVHSTRVSQAGFWDDKAKEDSINVRELKAIYYALILHAREGDIKELRLHTDNITALKYVTKAGGTASSVLQDLAVKIQDLCNQYSMKVHYQHIAGVKNTVADHLSRIHKPLHESSIPPRFFSQLRQSWGRRWKIDAFAASHNHKLPQYWSMTKDPFSSRMDAFQQS
ncbi:hypothetical protein, partial, partial [Parasitella parasitica]